jgi:hypothetical protein
MNRAAGCALLLLASRAFRRGKDPRANAQLLDVREFILVPAQ